MLTINTFNYTTLQPNHHSALFASTSRPYSNTFITWCLHKTGIFRGRKPNLAGRREFCYSPTAINKSLLPLKTPKAIDHLHFFKAFLCLLYCRSVCTLLKLANFETRRHLRRIINLIKKNAKAVSHTLVSRVMRARLFPKHCVFTRQPTKPTKQRDGGVWGGGGAGGGVRWQSFVSHRQKCRWSWVGGERLAFRTFVDVECYYFISY